MDHSENLTQLPSTRPLPIANRLEISLAAGLVGLALILAPAMSYALLKWVGFEPKHWTTSLATFCVMGLCAALSLDMILATTAKPLDICAAADNRTFAVSVGAFGFVLPLSIVVASADWSVVVSPGPAMDIGKLLFLAAASALVAAAIEICVNRHFPAAKRRKISACLASATIWVLLFFFFRLVERLAKRYPEIGDDGDLLALIVMLPLLAIPSLWVSATVFASLPSATAIPPFVSPNAAGAS